MQQPPDSDAEAQPLCPGGQPAAARYTESEPTDDAEDDSGRASIRILRDYKDRREENFKACSRYSADDILHWSALIHVAGSVWVRKSLWVTAWRMFVVSVATGVTVLFLVADPSSLAVGKFLQLSTFLNVFVGLLLSFFISSSMTRWYSCADGLVDLCIAIRNLQRELFALGVDEVALDDIIRLGVISGYLLDYELSVAALPKAVRAQASEEKWRMLEEPGHTQYTIVKPEEKAALQAVLDPPSVIWMWVGTLLGKLSKAEQIPPMASPTFGRFMTLVTQAHNGIRQVRSSVSVQPPYLYVQILAVLVHVNNILNALSFGLVLGASAGVIFGHAKVAAPHVDGHHAEHNVSYGEAARDSQNLLVSFFFSCAGPFIYQALLEVAVAIAQPFSSPEGSVPTHWLLKLLERDLVENKKVGQWFLENHPAAKAAEVADTGSQ